MKQDFAKVKTFGNLGAGREEQRPARLARQSRPEKAGFRHPRRRGKISRLPRRNFAQRRVFQNERYAADRFGLSCEDGRADYSLPLLGALPCEASPCVDVGRSGCGAGGRVLTWEVDAFFPLSE